MISAKVEQDIQEAIELPVDRLALRIGQLLAVRGNRLVGSSDVVLIEMAKNWMEDRSGDFFERTINSKHFIENVGAHKYYDITLASAVADSVFDICDEKVLGYASVYLIRSEQWRKRFKEIMDPEKGIQSKFLAAATSKEVGRILREAREAAGLSQAYVAEALGVEVRHVRRIEKGESKNPGWETVGRFAEAVGFQVGFAPLEFEGG